MGWSTLRHRKSKSKIGQLCVPNFDISIDDACSDALVHCGASVVWADDHVNRQYLLDYLNSAGTCRCTRSPRRPFKGVYLASSDMIRGCVCL